MAVVIERNECEACGQAEGVCMCPALVQVVMRYTDERYLLELLKAGRAVLEEAREWESTAGLDALEAAVLWVESDGLGPVAISGQAQLELEAATHAE